ncbi:hypothetical protein DXG01_010807, partial [Tephrocybe rancida]
MISSSLPQSGWPFLGRPLPCGVKTQNAATENNSSPELKQIAKPDWPPLNKQVGGGVSYSFSPDLVEPFAVAGEEHIRSSSILKFVAHGDSAQLLSYAVAKGFVHATVPVHSLVKHLTAADIRGVTQSHAIHLPSSAKRKDLDAFFENHTCSRCTTLTTVFTTQLGKCAKDTLHKQVSRAACRRHTMTTPVVLEAECGSSPPDHVFPPPPLTPELMRTVMKDFCKDSNPALLEETGCAVCGLLCPKVDLRPLKTVKGFLGVLVAPGVTRAERKTLTQPVKDIGGPVLDHACSMVCSSCRSSLLKGNVPADALARGTWIGPVPNVLKCLSFAEQLLVSKVRRSMCYARVSASGLHKMKAHVIAFEAPVQRVYETLPPPAEEMDEVLAILFTGPCEPTKDDLKRTPLLVRRNAVKQALEWLKLNHVDYSDVNISYANLSAYPEEEPPVSVIYKQSEDLVTTVAPSVFETPDNEGLLEGDCPFI